MAERYRIGELAERAGVSAHTLRYYEQVGLLRPATRSESGYRMYGPEDVERLAFINRSKKLGLTLEEIGELLAISDQGSCPCYHLQGVLLTKIHGLDEQIAELTALRARLQALSDAFQPGQVMCSCRTDLAEFARSRTLKGGEPEMAKEQEHACGCGCGCGCGGEKKEGTQQIKPRG